MLDSREDLQGGDEIQTVGLERICNYFGPYPEDSASHLDEGLSQPM